MNAAKVIQDVFGKTPQQLAREIIEESNQAYIDMLLEEIKKISVVQSQSSMTVSVKDLITILSVFEKETNLRIPLRIAYFLWIGTGIRLKGFVPNKTALRVEFKMQLEKINELLPGSYKLNHAWKRKGE